MKWYFPFDENSCKIKQKLADVPRHHRPEVCLPFSFGVRIAQSTMSNVNAFPDWFPMFSKGHGEITSGIFHGLDDQKVHANVPNGFKFGRGNNCVFKSARSGSEMVGHNVARPNQFRGFMKTESLGAGCWTGKDID